MYDISIALGENVETLELGVLVQKDIVQNVEYVRMRWYVVEINFLF